MDASILGRISFRDFFQGFSRASLGIRQGIAPSLSSAGIRVEGVKERKNNEETNANRCDIVLHNTDRLCLEGGGNGEGTILHHSVWRS